MTLTAKQKDDEKHTVIFDCNVVNQNQKSVLTGEAKVIAPNEKIIIKRPTLPVVSISDVLESDVA